MTLSDTETSGTGVRPELMLRGSDRPLVRRYDAAFLDLDGVVYTGGHAVPEAGQVLDQVCGEGMRLAYVTNNASRTPHAVAARLRALGVPARAADVVTSAQAAARLIAEYVPPGSPVLVVGGMGLRLAVRACGLRPVTTSAERPVAVVQGYAPNLTYDMFAEATLAVAGGARYVAANGDVTLPSVRGPEPGNGAFIQVVSAATGQEPIYAGKPEPPMFREATVRSGAHHPVMVGDSLQTDIEGACRAGLDSLLVLTGVTSPLDLVLAAPTRRPTYIAPDIRGLRVAHPEVCRDGDGWRCRGWVARWHEERLEVEGDGDASDGLRALCGAAWSRPYPLNAAFVRDAVDDIGPLHAEA